MRCNLCALRFFENADFSPHNKLGGLVCRDRCFPNYLGVTLENTSTREVGYMAYDIRGSLFKLCNDQLSSSKSRMWFPYF
jgi:hypothetical protein